jgi:hypothetical protein
MLAAVAGALVVPSPRFTAVRPRQVHHEDHDAERAQGHGPSRSRRRHATIAQAAVVAGHYAALGPRSPQSGDRPDTCSQFGDYHWCERATLVHAGERSVRRRAMVLGHTFTVAG